MLVFLSVIENTVVLCLCARSFTHNSKKSSRAEKNFHNARSLLSSYNRAGDLYGGILTEVVSTDRTHVHTIKVKTDLARLISCLFYGKNKNNSVRLCNWLFCFRTATSRISFFQILLVPFTFFLSSFLPLTEINIVRWKQSMILHFNLHLFHFKTYRSGCWSRWENLHRGQYPFQPIKFMNLIVPSACETEPYNKAK